MTVMLGIIVFLLVLIDLDLSNLSNSIDDLRRSNAEEMSSILKSIDDLRRSRERGVKKNDD